MLIHYSTSSRVTMWRTLSASEHGALNVLDRLVQAPEPGRAHGPPSGTFGKPIPARVQVILSLLAMFLPYVCFTH